MLGARARAAEYNAFKAASARQANREAEDHKMPPKPAPIALSAFTKNPQTNRNKGTKAWIPLVLEDTPEANDETSDDNEGTFSTPTRQALVDRSDSASRGSEAPLGFRNPRMGVIGSGIPKAPKSMLETSERRRQRFSPNINSTPRRAPLYRNTVTQPPQYGTRSSVQSSPSDFSGTCRAPMSTWPPEQYDSSMMGPSDISPTKQENKLASLSNDYQAPPQQPPAESGIPADSTMPTLFPPYYETPTVDWTAYPEVGINAWQPMQHPGQMMNSDGVENASTPAPMNPSLYTTNGGNRLRGDDGQASGFGRRQSFDHSPFNPPPQPRFEWAALSEDATYDRNTKMQDFMAIQQALAKTGKTVLRNPELHRAKNENGALSNASIGAAQERSIPGLQSDDGPPSLKLAPIAKPPPGLGWGLTDSNASKPVATAADALTNDAALREEFGVGTDEWLELKPVTRTQRLKMNNAMKRRAAAEAPSEPRNFSQAAYRGRMQSLQNSIQEEDRNSNGTGSAIEQIARDHVASRMSATPSDGISSGQSDTVAVEKASIVAVGTIMSRLAEPVEQTTSGKDHGSSIYAYKPAPEYAIERGRFLGGNAGSTSFFEDDTNGFYNAPSRIARDPRFRPATKDALKPKAEDEWKMRQDMYVRRRM